MFLPPSMEPPGPFRAVLFDVDFTLCRPGPELSPERYARIAARHGIDLDTSRYEDAREAAVLNLKRHPELLHDDSIWHAFTEEIFVGLGGPQELAGDCATEIEQGWEDAARQAVAEATKTLHGVTSVYIKEFQATVENDRVKNFRVDAKVSFLMERT